MSGIHKLGRRRRSTRHNDLSLGLRPENGSSENGPRSKPNSDVSLALVNNVIFNVYFDFFSELDRYRTCNMCRRFGLVWFELLTIKKYLFIDIDLNFLHIISGLLLMLLLLVLVLLLLHRGCIVYIALEQ